MYKNEFEIFKRFNEGLECEKLQLMVITVGGFVLGHYGMRTTQGIDGFYKSTAKVNKIIREVGDEFGINNADETWLNHSVENMNECPPAEICDKLYEFSNLTILMPPLEYIAGMKLESARRQDIEDVGAIIKRKAIDDPKGLRSQLQQYGFGGIDDSLLLEAFGKAYGMEWLEKYYIEHQNEMFKI